MTQVQPQADETETATQLILNARGVSHEYADRALFAAVDLELHAGQLVTVTGPNGIGKSTLLRCLAGIIEPSHGQIDRPQGFCCGYLGHRLGLRTSLTGRENLAFSCGLFAHNMTPINTLLDQAGILELIDAPVSHYSAGQRKRLALVRLVAGDTQVWILDEPASNLDTRGQSWMSDLCKHHLALGGSIVMAHHGELPGQISAHRVLQLGSPEQVTAA